MIVEELSAVQLPGSQPPRERAVGEDAHAVTLPGRKDVELDGADEQGVGRLLGLRKRWRFRSRAVHCASTISPAENEDEPNLVVERFGAAVVDARADGGEDAVAVLADRLAEPDERVQATAGQARGEPVDEGLDLGDGEAGAKMPRVASLSV